MRLWPEWAERMGENPPPGVSPRFHRVFARFMGFFTVYVIVTTAGFVLIGLLFLILAFTGQL